MTYVTNIVIWAVILIGFLIIEGATAQLVTIWFAAGALAALVTAALHGKLWLQFVIFIAVSVVALLVTRPLVKKITDKKQSRLNADNCIGKTAVVTETIDNIQATGVVKVNGILWTARSSDDSVIEEGKTVTIEKIEGVKVIVKEI